MYFVPISIFSHPARICLTSSPFVIIFVLEILFLSPVFCDARSNFLTISSNFSMLSESSILSSVNFKFVM